MSKLYDTPFKVGFAFNILVFAVLNIASYIIARDETQHTGVVFASIINHSWGFPTELYTTEGAIIGGFTIGACSFISGFLFKTIWSDICMRRLNKK